MKAENIKIEFIEWLARLDDKSLLTSLLQFKKASEKGDWSDNLTADQLESLQRGLHDMKNKKAISSQKFWSSYGKKIC
jgi:hypothetical protein